MKKIRNVIMAAAFCMLLLCSCSISHEVTEIFGKEENGLLEGLQLNDLEDIEKAADRILKKDPDKEGNKIDPYSSITDYHCEAGILISACCLLRYREEYEDHYLSDLIESVNDHMYRYCRYCFFHSRVFCPDRKGDFAAVVSAIWGIDGTGYVYPRLICYTRDGGLSWDYYYTRDDVTEFTYTEDGCFAYLSEYGYSNGVQDRKKLVFCDTLNGKINEFDVGFDRRGLSLKKR